MGAAKRTPAVDALGAVFGVDVAVTAAAAAAVEAKAEEV